MVVFSSSRPALRIGLFRKRAATGDHSTKEASSPTDFEHSGRRSSVFILWLSFLER